MRVWQAGKQSARAGVATLPALRACVCVCVMIGHTHMTGRLSGVGDVLIGYAWHDFCLEYIHYAQI